ncbi:hypothetical protein [Labrys neptuniae]|uniref:LemA family protein n=1 Tax=Labrys neptuniae TaxID=376174 RepID=A0ABV3PG59_9HYPH
MQKARKDAGDGGAIAAGLILLALIVCGMAWWLVRDDLCSAKTIMKDNDGLCFEFWLNRYQTLLVGLVAAALAVYGARSAWNAVRLQIGTIDEQAWQLSRGIIELKLSELREVSRQLLATQDRENPYGSIRMVLGMYEIEAGDLSVAELRKNAAACNPLMRQKIESIASRLEAISVVMSGFIVEKTYENNPIFAKTFAKSLQRSVDTIEQLTREN